MRPEDQSLEDYLQGRDGLSARYAELPMPQPLAELDARILAAARESLPVVASQPATATIIPLPNTRRWRLPLALAATVLLSVSVTLKLWEQPGVRMEAQMAAPEAPSVAAPAAPANEPTSTASASAAASAAADAAPAAAMSAESVEKRLTRRYAETMAPQVKEETTRRAQDAKPAEALRAAKPKLSVDAAERATDGAQRDNALGGHPPALAKDSAPQPESVMEHEAKVVAAPAPVPAKPNLAPALPLPVAKAASTGAASGALSDKADQNLAMPAPAPAPAVAKPMAASPAQVRGLAEEIGAAKSKKSEMVAEPATPEAWLKQIREQVARGDELAVREQMRRFRQRYPDFVVPEDLRKWLAPQ